MKAKTFRVALLAALIAPAPGFAATFTTYDTGDNSELIASSPGDNVKRVIYSAAVGSLAADDILIVASEAQLQNDTGGNVRLSTQLILGSSPGATTGTELDENNAFNVTADMVRGQPTKLAIARIASATSAGFVNLVVWTNQTLAVDQDYGRLQVLKIHP
ncbi:MAG TPA: hypothetical protein VG889_19455 [Rhizomicrobium sp.]|nr:hypothetical protein [Rhizomicrobium sp.]